MKIISKVKDYYDYLSGIYGIDEQIVYDRRNFEEPFGNLSKFPTKFYNHYLDDTEKTDFVLLEIGNIHYLFKTYEYITNRNVDKFYKKEHELVYKYKTDKKFSDVPLAMVRVYAYTDRTGKVIIRDKLGGIINNPILINTWIPTYIPANEIYELVYEYLSSEREPKINDNRSDIEKLESKGFDKKISFRHPIK